MNLWTVVYNSLICINLLYELVILKEACHNIPIISILQHAGIQPELMKVLRPHAPNTLTIPNGPGVTYTGSPHHPSSPNSLSLGNSLSLQQAVLFQQQQQQAAAAAAAATQTSIANQLHQLQYLQVGYMHKVIIYYY